MTDTNVRNQLQIWQMQMTDLLQIQMTEPTTYINRRYSYQIHKWRKSTTYMTDANDRYTWHIFLTVLSDNSETPMPTYARLICLTVLSDNLIWQLDWYVWQSCLTILSDHLYTRPLQPQSPSRPGPTYTHPLEPQSPSRPGPIHMPYIKYKWHISISGWGSLEANNS